MFLCKWHTSGCCCCFFFDLVFAGTITTPHRFYKSRFIGNNILEFIIVCGHISVCISVCTCFLEHIGLNFFQKFIYFCLKFIQADNNLLTCITACQDSLIGFDILRSDFNTNRDAAHLCLCKFPARFVVCCIQFHSETAESVFQFFCFLKDTFLVLGNWNNNHLCRSDHWRQDKTIVVTVNHDNSTDQTGCHTPGCLMDILQFIFFICVLNAEGSCKTITEVMACTGLKGLAVMH